MTPVTRDYYLNVYGGAEFDGLDSLLTRAGQVIMCAADPDSVERLCAEGSEGEMCRKNAVCAQAENIGLNGGVVDWLVDNVTGGSFTIGSFSMNRGGSSGASSSGGNGGLLCESARMWLERGGLLYRGTGVM